MTTSINHAALYNAADDLTIVSYGLNEDTGYRDFGLDLSNGGTVIDIQMDQDEEGGYTELNLSLRGIRLSTLSRHLDDPDDCWKSMSSGYDLTQLEKTVAYAMSDMLDINRVPVDCLASADNKSIHWVC